jgi:hypothetical protein
MMWQAFLIFVMLIEPDTDLHACSSFPIDASDSYPTHLGVAFRDRNEQWHQAIFCLGDYISNPKRKKAVLIGPNGMPIETSLPAWVTSITPTYHGNTDDCLFLDVTDTERPTWCKLKTLFLVSTAIPVSPTPFTSRQA